MLRLTDVKIRKYKSFETTSSVTLDKKITTLVGVNESGKTAFLESIAKTNYFDSDDSKFEFNTDFDYPRKEKKKMERENIDPIAIELTYEISDKLLKKIHDEFGNKRMEKNVILKTH